jgi:hypothetical protein
MAPYTLCKISRLAPRHRGAYEAAADAGFDEDAVYQLLRRAGTVLADK